jgi:hypothetical protein
VPVAIRGGVPPCPRLRVWSDVVLRVHTPLTYHSYRYKTREARRRVSASARSVRRPPHRRHITPRACRRSPRRSNAEETSPTRTSPGHPAPSRSRRRRLSNALPRQHPRLDCDHLLSADSGPGATDDTNRWTGGTTARCARVLRASQMRLVLDSWCDGETHG